MTLFPGIAQQLSTSSFEALCNFPCGLISRCIAKGKTGAMGMSGDWLLGSSHPPKDPVCHLVKVFPPLVHYTTLQNSCFIYLWASQALLSENPVPVYKRRHRKTISPHSPIANSAWCHLYCHHQHVITIRQINPVWISSDEMDLATTF